MKFVTTSASVKFYPLQHSLSLSPETLLVYTQVCLHCSEDFCRGDCLKYHYDQSQRKKKEPVDDLEVVENSKNTVDEEDEEEKEKRPRMKRQPKRRPRPNTAGSMHQKKSPYNDTAKNY